MADRPRTYTRRKAPPTRKGWGGVTIAGGRITGIERNAELVGHLWPSVAMEMLTDDAVQAGVEAILGTLLSARWTATPGDPSSAFSRKLADDLAEMLGLHGADAGMMTRGWEEVIGQLAMAELIGFAVGEPVWQWTPGAGVILADIEDRAQASIRRWHVEGGRLAYVEQAAAIEGDRRTGPVFMDAADLVIVSRSRVGLNYAGRGLLRGLFGMWRLKGHLLDCMGIAAERSAVGVPWLKTNWQEAQAAGVSRPDFDADLEVAREALDQLVAQDRHWIESGPGMAFEQVGGELDVSKVFVPGIELCDRGMLRGLLVSFLALGMSDGSGSRSLGEVTESFFRRNAAQGLDRIAAALNGVAKPGQPNGIVGRWVEYNHGPVPARLLPRLGHSGLTVHPILQLAQANGIDLTEWLPSTPERRAILARELQLPPEETPATPVAGGQA